MDELAAALAQTVPETPSQLIVEIHATLTNVLGSDSSRVFGTSGAPSLQDLRKAEAGQEGAEEEIDELEEDEDESENGGAGEAHDVPVRYTAEDREADLLVRRGIRYSKRWDRTAKLKYVDGRKGWTRHLIGALCQVG